MRVFGGLMTIKYFSVGFNGWHWNMAAIPYYFYTAKRYPLTKTNPTKKTGNLFLSNRLPVKSSPTVVEWILASLSRNGLFILTFAFFVCRTFLWLSTVYHSNLFTRHSAYLRLFMSSRIAGFQILLLRKFHLSEASFEY